VKINRMTFLYFNNTKYCIKMNNWKLFMGKEAIKKFHGALIVLILFLLTACAHTGAISSGSKDMAKTENDVSIENETGPEEFVEEKTISDPLEPWNRLVFTFNDRLYFWVMKPAAKGYNAVVPEVARTSVSNFFKNLTTPVRFVNALLQGKIQSAGIELARFGVNTTYGLAGLLDTAKKHFNLESQKKDLGLTLGFYGIGEGIYIIWPFLGPSSLRDTIGTVGDEFLTPVNYINPVEDALAVNSYEYFNGVSLHIGEYEDLKESAIDPYIAVKDSYIQHRRYLIKK
jgi:phospholipid-binding lipoprotein MlaA